MKAITYKVMGLAAASLTVLVLNSCNGKQETQQTQSPAINVLTISTGNSMLSNTYPATIKGKTDIEIRPQVSGFITKVHVDEGESVRKGQILFTIDQVQYQAAVDQANASVAAAKTAVATAQLTEQTKRTLLDKGIISEYDWQTADNSLQQAKAQLAQAEAQLISARKNLAYTVVTAPSDGVVGKIPNREGSLASPSSAQALTTISDNSSVYAYFSLTEKDILQLTDGGTKSLNTAIQGLPSVNLTLADGNIYPYEGKIATVSGVIDNTTGAASVRALFPNPNGMLHSGNTGSIIIPVESKDAIIIPQKATFEVQDKKFVYTVNDSNMTVSVPITVLGVNDGKNYVVTSGLTPGQRIVIEGVGSSVREGMPITPVEQTASQAQEEPQSEEQQGK